MFELSEEEAMKHPIFLLLVGLLGWCTGCTRTSESCPYSMQMAIDRMEHHPDSALAWLQGMTDSLEAMPEETRMYHQLLTLQAEDLQYIMSVRRREY